MRYFILWLEKQSKSNILTLGLACTALTGGLDLATAHGMGFEFFYLGVCALVGWAAGARAALVITLAAGVLLYWDESQSGSALLAGWVRGWNLLVRLLGFAGTGWLAAEAGRLTHELEGAVRQRTSRLQTEVEEHKETAARLREALQLFRQVTENITEVFWVTDPAKTRVNYVSPGFETVWGRPCQAVYGAPGTWLEGIHEADRERVTRAALSRQVQGTYDEEYRVLRPDGALRWVHDRAFPVRNEKAEVYRLVGIAEDITERKLGERLRQAQHDAAVALSLTSDAAVAAEELLMPVTGLEGIDCGGVYLAGEPDGALRLKAHRGLSARFVQGVTVCQGPATESTLLREWRRVQVERERARKGPASEAGELLRGLAVVLMQHQGEVIGALILGSHRADEIPAQTRAALETIAAQAAGALARIRAEDLLRRSEARLRAIVTSAPIALFATDHRGTILFEEGQALSALGFKPGENVGREAAEVYRDHPLALENVRRALAGEEFSSVLEFGDNVVECRYTPGPSQTAGVTGFIAVATNITERYRLERQILEISDREQARIGQDIHDGLCQQIVGAALVVNSLRQALASQTLPEAGTAERISTLLDEAITESRRVTRGLYPVRLRTDGLAPALEELARLTSERFGVACVCEATGEVQCDTTTATHLYRIAQEAVNNAVKHSGARNITIRLSADDGALELEVRDDGSGIPQAPLRTEGMGLHIMDYRARGVGATLSVKGGATGTVVTCRLVRKATSSLP